MKNELKIGISPSFIPSFKQSITILGTSHIAQQSIEEITTACRDLHPGLIAVELDAERASALLEDYPQKVPLHQLFRLGWKGVLFAKLAQYVQQHLGKTVGVNPGAEMKTALLLAKEQKIPVALIDQPIQVTLKNFSRQFTWKEKFQFLKDILGGLLFPRRAKERLGLAGLDLRKVPSADLVEKMMVEVETRYPSLYKVLVDDRNKYMVRQLVKLLRQHPGKKILVIVGMGHKKGMEMLLQKVDVLN